MKNKRFKVLSLLFFVIVIMSFKSNLFALSDDFRFCLDTIGIPEYNAIGKSINEEFYYKYNVFVYGNPLDVYAYTSDQRFKSVNNGKDSNNGVTGEYNILGFNFSGGLVYNVYFPVDKIPETTPDNWNFTGVQGASESWDDTSKFKYQEQKDYMKTTKLLFDTIDYANNTIDPYNLKEYNISASSIGLDKVMLNTASTWKTNGIVTVRRITPSGYYGVATMSTKPMAASASTISTLNIDDNLDILEDEDYKIINVSFGAKAINLNDYAKKEYIKEINSKLYINGVLIDEISSSKTDEVTKNKTFKIDRNAYVDGDIIDVKVVSYLYTEFIVDGLLKSEIQKDIKIHITPKKEVPKMIENSECRVLDVYNGEKYVKNLFVTNNTVNNSLGIIEGKRNLLFRINKKNINDFSKLDVYINDNKLAKNEYELYFENEKYFVFKINVNEKFNNTIEDWNTLRDKNIEFFNIDFSSVGNRIKEPNIVKFIYENDKLEFKIDKLSDYLYNNNFTFYSNFSSEDKTEKVLINKWLEN